MFHVKHRAPHVLLISPWIFDFAAYNFWIKPLGLLYIASLLRKNGFRITLIDCLDFREKKKYGDGKFFRTKIKKPLPVVSFPRNYCQYGMPEEFLLKRLSLIEEKPDLIGITSAMTYWYPGVFRLIELLRKIFGKVPIVLGGIYATLCYEHAKEHSGADFVFNGRGEWKALKFISELTDVELKTPDSERQANALPYPSFDLYPSVDYVCILTSRGCPFQCVYCASPVLTKRFIRRDPFEVLKEIEHWVTRYEVKNIAFYDDALLIEPDKYIIPLLKEIVRRGIPASLHAPNGLHVREIGRELADLLFCAGFKTVRLGFETSSEVAQRETGGKVNNQEFQWAVKSLKEAGYFSEEIGAYVLAGLPGQRVGEVEESISFVREAGARPYLVEYSPVPHTRLFEIAKERSSFDLENEPLFHNNSIFPCQWEGFTMSDLKRLRMNLRGTKE